MNILVISPLNPFPVNEGRRFRIHATLKALARDHRVTVICQVTGADRACLSELERLVHRVIPVDKAAVRNYQRPGSRLSRFAEYFLSPAPWLTRSRVSEEIQDKMRRIDWSEVDVLWVINMPLAGNVEPWLERARRRGIKTVIDLDDYESAKQWRMLQRLPLGSFRQIKEWVEYRRIFAYERRVVPRFSLALVCSEQDQRILLRRGIANAVSVPNTLPLEGYPSAPRPEQYDLVFTGMMGYVANVDAMTWFCRTAWPLILRRRPQTGLWIVGRNPDPRVVELGRLAGVTVTGAVQDVQAYLAGARVVVVPLRMGGGTRIKILEAMACHRPVVTTRLGCEGLNLGHGRQGLIADNPKDLATACLTLLEDGSLRRRMGQAGRALVERDYSWERLPAILRPLLNGHPVPYSDVSGVP